MQLTQAILPVAGLGTRFLPWTKVVPKELLPLGSQPIIAHLVDECLDVGIREICFVISRGKEMIPQYFYQDTALEQELERRGKLHYLGQLKRYDEIKFHVVYQEEQKGDGHAILQAADWVKDGHVAILFGDDLFVGKESGLQQLQRAQRQASTTGAMFALQRVPSEDVHRYGIVEVKEEHPQYARIKEVKGLVEKPAVGTAPSDLAIVGRYIIPQSTLAALLDVGASHGGEIRLIDALIAQLGTVPIFGYECEGERLDTGTPEGYRDAVQKIGG